MSDVRPSDRRRAAQAAAGAVGLDEASTLSDSAVKLAQELQRVPGIERFGGTRLRDLERSGPRTLRTLWGAARDELETRYGDVTIGMLLDEYERSSGGGAPGPEPLTRGARRRYGSSVRATACAVSHTDVSSNDSATRLT